MHDVFISYSTIDLVPAETVRNVLESNQIPCWMAPRDIPAGSNYVKEIPAAIRNCQVFVLILSRNAQNSQWVLRELDAAVNCGKTILPFMLEDHPLNDEFNFLLTGAQRYAAYQRKAETMEKLVTRIHAIIRRDDPEAPVTEPKVQEPVQQEAQADAVPPTSFASAVCPACGSEDLSPQKSKNQRNGFFEKLTLGISIAGGIVCGIVLTLVLLMFLEGSFLDLYPILLLVFSLVSGKLIDRFVMEQIRRRRIRKHIRVEFLHCNQCSKNFAHETPLS